jgi:broad specificity phosphatase PhoE
MEAPAITRQRRPFLAPIWVTIILGLVILGLAVAAYRSLGTTTVVLVRHGEKELSSISDSPLAPEGELRAERLAQIFGQISGVGRLEAIYVSDTRRTQQTAAALAARLGLQPVILPGADVATVAHHAMNGHRGSAVLIVGHSNTIPQIIKRIAGVQVPSIADDEFDNIYIVSVPTLGHASLIRLKY